MVEEIKGLSRIFGVTKRIGDVSRAFDITNLSGRVLQSNEDPRILLLVKWEDPPVFFSIMLLRGVPTPNGIALSPDGPRYQCKRTEIEAEVRHVRGPLEQTCDNLCINKRQVLEFVRSKIGTDLPQTA